MGACEEIHDRERSLIWALAPKVLHFLRRREGAGELNPAAEVDWGRVRFRVRLGAAPITITLAIDP
jgi:hypothetical protein